MTNAELGIPEYSVRRKPTKKPYRKPESVKAFQREHMARKYAGRNIPQSCHIETPFDDKTANGLTKLIIAWMTMHNHFAARINSGAVYDQRLGIYRKGSGATAGMADVNAVMGGKSVSIEVKIGKDKIRESQLKVKAQIEQAGGVYIIVRSFDDFLQKIEEINK
jgi:uncharacterized short protein YbdD (DUF466 family)